jgi:hypothetical protein
VRLVFPGTGGQFSVTAPHVQHGVVSSLGELMICTLGGPATVVGVKPWQGTPAEDITAFATQPNPFLIHPHRVAMGNALGTLPEHGFNIHKPETVKACQGAGTKIIAPTDFAFSIRRRGAGTGTDHGLLLTYQDSTGDRGQAVLPVTYTLCAPKNPPHPLCTFNH